MDFVGTASGMLNLKMHVLVVDDYSVIRKIICNSLKKIGFENIHAAENGTEALTILQDIAPPVAARCIPAAPRCAAVSA